jgi:translation initiation factor 2 subunit 3
MLTKPIFNLGCLGPVSNGKSTVVYQLTGTKTPRHSTEKTRNITIKPGYANMKIWQKLDGTFITTNSETIIMEDATLVHHLSFVDCPGHQELILTMMSSVSLMNGALIVVSADEPMKNKPQLLQHLAAAKMAGLTKLIIIFNKLDLVTKEKAMERKKELDEILLKLEIVPNYIIPTALNKKIGLQNVIKAIMETFPPVISDSSDITPEFKITRSFDINKPGVNWDEIQGGVIGGSLISGQLKIGDLIEIRPGQWSKKKDGTFHVVPILTSILSIETDKIPLDILTPGGLSAIKTDIDPFYTKNDKLAGNIIGIHGSLPHIYSDITIDVTLITDFEGYWDMTTEKSVYLQLGNINTEAELISYDDKICNFKLSKPSCISDDSLILVCTHTDSDILKICGYGKLISEKCKIII